MYESGRTIARPPPDPGSMSGAGEISARPSLRIAGAEQPGGPVRVYVHMDDVRFDDRDAEPCRLRVSILCHEGLSFDGEHHTWLEIALRPDRTTATAFIDVLPTVPPGTEVVLQAHVSCNGRHSGYAECKMALPPPMNA